MRHESDWWLGGFLIGFFVGLSLTLIYGWYLDPRIPTITPAQLDLADTETYILLIAAAYRSDRDLAKAEARLAKFKMDNVVQFIGDLAEHYINQNADIHDIHSLVVLADGLGQPCALCRLYLPTATSHSIEALTTIGRPSTAITSPTPTSTQIRVDEPIPRATLPSDQPLNDLSPTPNPTITPRSPKAPRVDPPFRLAQSVPLCDNSSDAHLRIYVQDRQGQGIPGIKINVRWANGEDSFFTGLKPEIDSGYADFDMQPDTIYQVSLGDSSITRVKDINQNAKTRCTNLANDISPSWQLVFQQTN